MEDFRDRQTFGDGVLSLIQARHSREASWVIMFLEKVVLIILQKSLVNKRFYNNLKRIHLLPIWKH